MVKHVEKLASGFRINGATDSSAGLSISEKELYQMSYDKRKK